MKKEELREGRIICYKCRVECRPAIFEEHGFRIHGCRCPKCGEEFLDSEEAELLLELLKYEKFEVKVGKLGKTKIIRIPATIARFYNIEEGKPVLLEPKPEKIILTKKK